MNLNHALVVLFLHFARRSSVVWLHQLVLIVIAKKVLGDNGSLRFMMGVKNGVNDGDNFATRGSCKRWRPASLGAISYQQRNEPLSNEQNIFG